MPLIKHYQTQENFDQAEVAKCKEKKDINWKALVEHRVNNLRQECDNPNARGMSTAPRCLADYIDALEPCSKVDKWKADVKEWVRSAQAAQKNRRASGEPVEIRKVPSANQ